MSARVLNWGVLGTSRVNQLVLPAFASSPRNRLAAIASRDAGRARAAAEEWQIPKAYTGFEALLADPEIDVIYISLSNHLHVEWTLNAIAAGKHVFCEKPLALSAAEVDRVAAAAQAAGVVVAEALMYRSHPLTGRVMALLAEGAIGEVRMARSWFTIQVLSETESRLFPELGGGCLWDLGVYPLSLLRLIMGGEPESLSGMGTMGKTGVDESYFGALRFPGDRYGEFHCSFRLLRRMGLEVVGSEGTLSVPWPFRPGRNAEIALYRSPHGGWEGSHETIVVPGDEPYRPEIENMADAVLDGAPVAVSLQDTRGTIAVVEDLLARLRE